MSSFSDLSQISDIQNVSRISRVNTSRIIGRIDSSQSLFDQRSMLGQNASRSMINIHQRPSIADKTARTFACCEESMGELAKNKIILDCVKEASMNDSKVLPEDVAEKLRGILLMYEVDKYMRLPSMSKDKQGELTILGITDLPKYELSYEEKLDVKCCVEALLREKIHEFIIRYETLGGSVKEIMRANDCHVHKCVLEPNEARLLSWKDKMEKLCTQYLEDLLRSKSLMSLWNKGKYTDMRCTILQDAEYLLLQAEVAEVQAKITKMSCIIRMFKETPITITAFRMLSAILDDKLLAIMAEIKQKEDLKQQYDNLRNTEFDEVLKTYTDLCRAINKKKKILQNI